MTQKMVIYFGLGWLLLVVGPLTITASIRLNKAIRMIHPDKGFLIQMFPVSPQLKSAMKADRTYQKLLWANVSSVVVFFLLMFAAKNMV